jgi:hypothetical protein
MVGQVIMVQHGDGIHPFTSTAGMDGVTLSTGMVHIIAHTMVDTAIMLLTTEVVEIQIITGLDALPEGRMPLHDQTVHIPDQKLTGESTMHALSRMQEDLTHVAEPIPIRVHEQIQTEVPT